MNNRISEEPETKRPQFALRLVSYGLVLAVGLAGGYYLGSGVKWGEAVAFDMVESTYYSAYLDTQLSEGTDAAREEAIRAFLALIERRRERQIPVHSERMLAIDAALANARLAALAQKRGAQQEAKDYLSRATSYCEKMEWQNCSAEKIAYVAERLDTAGMFGKKGASSK